MAKVAVFVDAGYLLTEGISVVAGRRGIRRTEIDLDPVAAVTELRQIAEAASDGAKLLRVYWYDAVPRAGMSGIQSYIALADDVKFRAGSLVKVPKGRPRQKGVDSLIVADLIELARNRAVEDILLVTGDEDSRIGVASAQRVGVRVHLLGISPASKSQSFTLRQEADTLLEIDSGRLRRFMSLVPELPAPNFESLRARQNMGLEAMTGEVVRQLLDSLPTEVWQKVWKQRVQEFTVPWVYARLMASLHDAMGRRPSAERRREAHQRFKHALEELVTQP